MVHMTQPIELSEKQVEEFWARVHKTAACWIWEATMNRGGYGMRRVGQRMHPAHRIAYTLERGVIPAGMQIDHICHSRACVNPDHLRLATHKQNMENLAGAQKNSKTGVRGVSWDKQNNRWRASICHNLKKMNLGNYRTIEEAEAVVKAKRLELFTHNESDK